MIYTDLTRKAMILAYEAHQGQKDRAGVPYIYHPMHLAEQMDSEIECVVALLHDVVEDTSVTFEDLENEFPKEAIDILKLLTHDKSIDYMSYVEHIKNNSIAKKVKIADIMHNSDEKRLLFVTEKDLKRNEKYSKALGILKNKDKYEN